MNEPSSDQTSSSQRVRLASIGVGMIGKVHAQFAAQLDDCEYVAIYLDNNTVSAPLLP